MSTTRGDLWAAVIDDVALRMGRRRGVPEDKLRETTWRGERREAREALDSLSSAALEDPHLLGWLHQSFGEPDRDDAFASHVHDGARHRNATATTRLYTPRWVADVLAEGALELCEGRPTVVDPAVGGGQMLLAALSALHRREPEAEPADLLTRLAGVDLDGRAVEVARRTLALETARLFPSRVGREWAQWLEILAGQIEEGDGLMLPGERFSVALTNPPYMGWRSMPEAMRRALKPEFSPYHGDLFAAFIARCHDLAESAVGVLAQQSIWYLRRFEEARRDLYSRGGITHFLHLGAGLFGGLSGEKASVVAFVQRCDGEEETSAVWDLRGVRGADEKQRRFRERSPESLDVGALTVIPGAPFSHDLPGPLRELFRSLPRLEDFADLPSQNKTAANRTYVRGWKEVPPGDLRRVEEFGGRGRPDGPWVFYSKGGRFAPWWGNWEWVVDFGAEAREFYAAKKTANLLAQEHWFRPGLVYTDFGGRRFGARRMPAGCVFDMTGPAIFAREEAFWGLTEEERSYGLLAILNSSVARRLLNALNPTLHYQVRDLRALPIPEVEEAVFLELAAEARVLTERVRELHRWVPGDPLYEGEVYGGEGACGVDLEEVLEELRRREARLDRRVGALYGVKAEPVPSCTIADHHRLSGLRMSAKAK